MNTHDIELPPLPPLGPRKAGYTEFDMQGYAQITIEPYAKRIAELEAARLAYASEFEPDEDGVPDVGSIHENIRKLKADRQRRGGPVELIHMATIDEGELRMMSGRKPVDCELYAMPDLGRAPDLYAAPVAAQAQPYADSTPHLSVGDSSFESWYDGYLRNSLTIKPGKQRLRDAYAAGMGDPLVRAAQQPVSGADGLPVPYPNPDDVTPAMRAGFERLFHEANRRYHGTLARNERGAYRDLHTSADWVFYQRAWADALAAQPQPSGNAGELPTDTEFDGWAEDLAKLGYEANYEGVEAYLRKIFSDRAALAAQASGQAQQDTNLTGDELQAFINTCDQFSDCGETDTNDTTLMRWAALGLLECTRFEVTPRGDDLIDAARAAAKGEV